MSRRYFRFWIEPYHDDNDDKGQAMLVREHCWAMQNEHATKEPELLEKYPVMVRNTEF